MNSNNLSQRDLKRAILSAKRTSLSDGWPILVEALLVGIIVAIFSDNALVGLLGFGLALYLLVQKFIGYIVSLVLAGYVCLRVCESINQRINRLDFALVGGLIVGFLVLSFHTFHINAVREFFGINDEEGGGDDDEEEGVESKNQNDE